MPDSPHPRGTACRPEFCNNDCDSRRRGCCERRHLSYAVAPGVFSADASGGGLVAAVAQRQKPDGAVTYEAIVRFDPAVNKFVAIPIDLGPDGDHVFLSIFGTGWRFRSSETAAKVKVGGVEVPVLYVGLQPTLEGVDQINVELTRTLA